jgi:hypothetical protein
MRCTSGCTTAPPPITTSPRIRVEYAEGIAATELSDIRERLVARLRDLLVFTPDLELLPPGTFPRHERKRQAPVSPVLRRNAMTSDVGIRSKD